jgi:hypothetical protein
MPQAGGTVVVSGERFGGRAALVTPCCSDLQPRDELRHNICCRLWTLGERNALSGPHGYALDVTGGTNHWRCWLVPDYRFA